MKEKTIRSGKGKALALGIALILLLTMAFFASNSLAKYRTQVIVAGEVQYTNRLAKSFQLLDRALVQGEDGSYQMNKAAESNNGNTYYLIPGTQPPAAPYIVIEEKSEIPAYLYVEVVVNNVLENDALDENGASKGLSVLPGGWQKLSMRGRNAGDGEHSEVYVYPVILVGSPEAGDDNSTMTISVPLSLKDLDSVPADKAGSVRFYAYMIQKTDDSPEFSLEAAKAAFASVVPQS